MALGELQPGQMARIIGFSGTLDLQSRLVEMGLLNGTPVRLIKKAPFNGPIEIKVRGYYVSIRMKDAMHILIEK